MNLKPSLTTAMHKANGIWPDAMREARVTLIEIHRWDWPDHPQSIPMRLQPILRPRTFRYTVRALVINNG